MRILKNGPFRAMTIQPPKRVNLIITVPQGTNQWRHLATTFTIAITRPGGLQNTSQFGQDGYREWQSHE